MCKLTISIINIDTNLGKVQLSIASALLCNLQHVPNSPKEMAPFEADVECGVQFALTTPASILAIFSFFAYRLEGKQATCI
jgi:hypothetical protein